MANQLFYRQQHLNGENGPLKLAQGDVSEEIMVPGDKCGLVIGKSGDVIRGIQDATFTTMFLLQDSTLPGEQPKPLRIIGKPENVAKAKQMVEQIVATENVKGIGLRQVQRFVVQHKAPVYTKLIVPSTSVGMIIGRNGETIRTISQQTGARIQFDKENTNTAEACALIEGDPNQIKRAIELISNVVNKSVSPLGPIHAIQMAVPAEMTGAIIGTKGETIKQISRDTGASVELERDLMTTNNEKVFKIRGTPLQIAHAQQSIRTIVERNFGHPSGIGFQFQSVASAGQETYVDPNLLAQLMTQTQNQPTTSAVDPTPLINPITGEPDYSLQWIAFYRSTSDFDKADRIEKEMLERYGNSVLGLIPPHEPAMTFKQEHAPGA